MKQYTHFFGVDISKKTIDISLLHHQSLTLQQFTNDSPGMKALLQWLKELKTDFTQALFCMEATGLYYYTLTPFLTTQAIDTWIEHATRIKRATALDRGKNDKVDSKRIALYCSKNLDRLQLWKPTDITVDKLWAPGHPAGKAGGNTETVAGADTGI